jgi:hypothetical protein
MGGIYGSRQARRPGRLVRRTSLVVALLAGPAVAVLSFATPVSATNAPALNYGPASWWSGTCDATHWNQVAQDDGWSGSAAHPLGASYLGIQVCGPRPAEDGSPDVVWSRPGYAGLEWECVELAFRFMGEVYGVRAYSADGYDVVANYSKADGGGLVKIQNGTPGEAPEPGDVISFSDGSEGHVAVVAGSDVDAYGNGSITLISQNDTTDGWRTLGVQDWTVEGFNIFTATEWLHDPLGRGNPDAPPTVMNSTLPNTAVGLQYSAQLTSLGGSRPYRWSIVSGTLPAGLVLGQFSGQISGVPVAQASSKFEVEVTSVTGASSVKPFTIAVAQTHAPVTSADFDDDLAVG